MMQPMPLPWHGREPRKCDIISHMNRYVIAAAVVFVLNLSAVLLLTTREEIEIPVQPLTPQEYLYANCSDPDCNPELLDAIATCESQWRMVQNNRSSAYGYFQILDSTEKTTPQWKEGGRKYDPYTSVDMGIYLFESRGSNPWNESKGCWYWKYQLSQSRPPIKSVGVKKV